MISFDIAISKISAQMGNPSEHLIRRTAILDTVVLLANASLEKGSDIQFLADALGVFGLCPLKRKDDVAARRRGARERVRGCSSSSSDNQFGKYAWLTFGAPVGEGENSHRGDNAHAGRPVWFSRKPDTANSDGEQGDGENGGDAPAPGRAGPRPLDQALAGSCFQFELRKPGDRSAVRWQRIALVAVLRDVFAKIRRNVGIDWTFRAT